MNTTTVLVVLAIAAVALIIWLVIKLISNPSPIVLTATGGTLMRGGAPLTPNGTLLIEGDQVISKAANTCTISGAKGEFTLNLGENTTVLITLGLDDGTPMNCAELQEGRVDYAGDPISIKGAGRRYIVRTRGFAVGTVGTKFFVVTTGKTTATATVTEGSISIAEEGNLNHFRGVATNHSQDLIKGTPVANLPASVPVIA